MSLLPCSRLGQPGAGGLAHSHESETPVTSDRPGIKVSPTLSLKTSRALRGKKTKPSQPKTSCKLKLDQFKKEMIQVLAT